MTFSILRPHMLRSFSIEWCIFGQQFWPTSIHVFHSSWWMETRNAFEPSSICSWEHVLDLKIPSQNGSPTIFDMALGIFVPPYGSHKNSSFNHKCRANDWSDSPLCVPWKPGSQKISYPISSPVLFFPQYHGPHIVPTHVWWLNGLLKFPQPMFHGDFLDLDLCSRLPRGLMTTKVAVQLQTIVFTGSRGHAKCCTAQPWWCVIPAKRLAFWTHTWLVFFSLIYNFWKP